MANCLKCGTYMGENKDGSIYCSRCTLDGIGKGLGQIATTAAGPIIAAIICTVFISFLVAAAILFTVAEAMPDPYNVVLVWLSFFVANLILYRPMLRFVKQIMR